MEQLLALIGDGEVIGWGEGDETSCFGLWRCVCGLCVTGDWCGRSGRRQVWLRWLVPLLWLRVC
jgi:hypothetical protein